MSKSISFLLPVDSMNTAIIFNQHNTINYTVKNGARVGSAYAKNGGWKHPLSFYDTLGVFILYNIIYKQVLLCVTLSKKSCVRFANTIAREETLFQGWHNKENCYCLRNYNNITNHYSFLWLNIKYKYYFNNKNKN